MTVIGLFGYWAAAGALCNESASRLPAIRRHTSAMVFLPPTRRRDDGRRAPFAQVAGGGRPDGRAAVHPRYLSRDCLTAAARIQAGCRWRRFGARAHPLRCADVGIAWPLAASPLQLHSEYIS